MCIRDSPGTGRPGRAHRDRAGAEPGQRGAGLRLATAAGSRRSSGDLAPDGTGGALEERVEGLLARRLRAGAFLLCGCLLPGTFLLVGLVVLRALALELLQLLGAVSYT